MKKLKVILGLLAVMLLVQFSSIEADATDVEASDVEVSDVEVTDMETSDVDEFDAPEEETEEELASQAVDADHLLIQEGGDEILLREPVNPRQRAISNEEKAMNDLVKAMRNRATKQDLSAYKLTVSTVNDIYAIILNYYPEFFYVSNMEMYYNTSTGFVKYVTIEYQYDKSYSDRYFAALDKAYKEAITDPTNMTDLQKARALHDYICQHTEYDLSYTKYNAYNALVERTAVCQGYSLLYAALLQKAGIDYDFVTSRAMNHMWNLVYNGGYWYHVDTTWDDPVSMDDYNKAYLADAVGNAGHNHFMVSDAKIQSLNHYSYSSPYTCSNKNLDNAYWQGKVSAIFVINDREYYLKGSNGKSASMIERYLGQEKVLFTVSDVWNVWGNSNSYWTGMYQRLSYYNGTLYFNGPKKVYATQPGQTSYKTIYNYTKTDGYIYGTLVCADKIYMGIGTNPNNPLKLATASLPGNAISSVSASASPQTLTYGYTSGSKLTASVTIGSGYSGTPSYQWYQVVNGTEKTISGATKSSYTVPTGLAVGEHTYRVKATLSGYTKSADVKVTVTDVPIAENDTIYRIAGPTRYETSFMVAKALKEELGVSKFNTVIVSCGTNFADALAGSYLAAKTNAPILMANEGNPSQLAKFVSDNLVKGGKIYILGGTNAVSAKIENALKPYGSVKRLSGADRYETNLAILKEANVTRDDIIVCTGTGFADSLSASALGKPILLVGNKLNSKQKEYLSGLSGNHYYIIGGTTAVKAAVEKEIKQYDKNVKRLSGADRYQTSVMVADEFFNKPYEAVITYGRNFPDGLSGGPLAMSKNAPLILTETNAYTTAATYMRDYKITKGAVLGGTTLITDNVVKKIFNVNKVQNWK